MSVDISTANFNKGIIYTKNKYDLNTKVLNEIVFIEVIEDKSVFKISKDIFLEIANYIIHPANEPFINLIQEGWKSYDKSNEGGKGVAIKIHLEDNFCKCIFFIGKVGAFDDEKIESRAFISLDREIVEVFAKYFIHNNEVEQNKIKAKKQKDKNLKL